MRLLVTLLVFLSSPLHAAELTVATFNIRYDTKADKDTRNWKARRDLVVATIRKINPDIVGIQEALASQVDFLAKELPDYHWIGVGRDDGKRKGEFCAIFYRTARINLVPDSAQTFWLSDSPDEPGSKTWGNQVTRICTWAEFTDKTTTQTLVVFNTHWDHQHQGSREHAATMLLERSKASRTSKPTIILGDFNATETNPAVQTLLSTKVDAPLRSAYLELHADEPNRRTFNNWIGNKEGQSTIDHVIISPHWQIKRAWIDDHHQGNIWPSDHYPVAATLTLP